jgi:5-methylcytosine-specific restriction enzyme A
MATRAQRLKALNHKSAENARESSHRRGYDRKWASFRIRFLKANPLCVRCKLDGYTVAATQVDHIVPHRGDKALFWRESNLQPLCHSCHSKKTAQGQ